MSDHEERRAAEAAQKARQVQNTLSTPQFLENLKTQAQYRRLRYLSFVEAGFEPGQALYLCHQT